MKLRPQLVTLSLIFVALTSPNRASAWAERGHHMVCEIATKMVKEPALKAFFESRGDLMGHVCNIPDISWRSLPGTKTGDQAHFMNPENAGVSIERVPPTLVEYFALRKTQENTQTKAEALGSNWWRAEQLYNLAVAAGKIAQTSPAPTKPDQQNGDFPYNKAVYSWMENLGLMGHFVGDSSMPFHNNADYDGWETGHGGIHSHYEGACVAFYDFNLIIEASAQAAALQSANYVTGKSVVEISRKIAIDSSLEKAEIEHLDKVLEPSKLTTDTNGVQNKVYAKRSPLNISCPPFRALIAKQIARSAISLAALWDKSYVDAKKPVLTAYRSYLYPLVPQFTPVNYLIR